MDISFPFFASIIAFLTTLSGVTIPGKRTFLPSISFNSIPVSTQLGQTAVIVIPEVFNSVFRARE